MDREPFGQNLVKKFEPRLTGQINRISLRREFFPEVFFENTRAARKYAIRILDIDLLGLEPENSGLFQTKIPGV